MVRPRRVPWFAVDVDMRANEKMVALPNDSARYGWVLGVLAEGKRSSKPGQFRNRDHVAEVIGRFGRFVRNYLDVGLLEEAPKLCDRCRADYGPLDRGRVVIHDWWRKQRDPAHADRQALYRAQRDAESDDDERHIDVTKSPQSDAIGDGSVQSHSRARAGRQRQVQRQEPLEEDRSPARDPDDEPPDADMDDVVDSLKRRGYRRVTAGQRRLLEEVAGREGWSSVVAWIQTAPNDVDPIEHVKVVSNADRAQRVTAARRREADHERTKSGDAGPIASQLASTMGTGVAPPRRANGHATDRDALIAKFATIRGSIDDGMLERQMERHGLTLADLEGVR